MSPDKALVYALDHVDIYACAWGPDGIVGNLVGYNKVPESLLNGTKYVSILFFIQFPTNVYFIIFILKIVR